MNIQLWKVTNEVQEHSTAIIVAGNLTGVVYPVNAILRVTETQKNVPGVVEWLHLENGKWVPYLLNSRVKAVFQSNVIDPVPTPPPTGQPVIESVIITPQYSDGTFGEPVVFKKV